MYRPRLCGIAAVLRVLAVVLFVGGWIQSAGAHPDHEHDDGKGAPGSRPAVGQGGTSSTPLSYTGCGPSGQAGVYPCRNIDLYSFLPLGDVGAAANELANDIWGWHDKVTSRDYALLGLEGGMSIVDVTSPTSPVHVGKLPTHSSFSAWRDIKVYQDHAYVVADAAGNHGLQVFDLTQLRNLDPGQSGYQPVTFAETAHYGGFANSHNLAINEQTGFGYAVGTNTFSGGLHFVDLGNPAAPVAAGGFASSASDSFERYTHDTQVVTYHGPDADHVGREIALNSNQRVLNIADVTDKGAPTELSHTSYPLVNYTHQGSLTEDHRYFLMNDEGDERNSPSVEGTRTHIWDLQDLDNPEYIGFYSGRTKAIDHNLYTFGDLAFEANYRSGLRILDLSDIRNGDLRELGYFDVYPESNSAAFNGAWSVFRFEESGTTIVSGIESGLYVLDTSGITPVGATLGLSNPGFEKFRRRDQQYSLPDNAVSFSNGNTRIFDENGDFTTERDIDLAGWILSGVTAINPTDTQFAGASQDLPGLGVSEGVVALQVRSGAGRFAKTHLADLLEPDTLYSLDVDVGQALSHSEHAGYVVSLYAGGELLGEVTDLDVGAASIPVGTFATVGLEVDSSDFPHLLGQPFEIRLASRVTELFPGDGFTFFDNVHFSSEPLLPSVSGNAAPEPAGMLAWLLLGVIGLERRYRRT